MLKVYPHIDSKIAKRMVCCGNIKLVNKIGLGGDCSSGGRRLCGDILDLTLTMVLGLSTKMGKDGNDDDENDDELDAMYICEG